MANSVTINDAANAYVASLAQERRSEAQEAIRFARWLGAGRAAADVRAPDVEAYMEALGPATAAITARADALKGFFAYAHKEQIIPERLVSHVRVRRAAAKAKPAGAVERRPDVQLTAEGAGLLRADLEALIAQRPRIADDLRHARIDKDVRENAPLEAAREALGHLEARIRELEAKLKGSVTIKDQPASDEARAGSRVILLNLATGTRLTYMLVAAAEARAADGRLSIESPVGQAVVGRRAGDEVEVTAPAGTLRFRIEAVEPA